MTSGDSITHRLPRGHTSSDDVAALVRYGDVFEAKPPACCGWLDKTRICLTSTFYMKEVELRTNSKKHVRRIGLLCIYTLIAFLFMGANMSNGQDIKERVVIWIHGGAWQSGESDLRYAHSSVQKMLKTGRYTVIPADYPLAPLATIKDQILYLERLINQVRQNKPRAEIHLVGHSAGATLSLLVQRQELTSIQAIAPVIDFVSWVHGDEIYGYSRRDLLRTALGCSLCTTKEINQYNPIQKIIRGGARVVIHAGLYDKTSDIKNYQRYVANLRRFGMAGYVSYTLNDHGVKDAKVLQNI